VISGERAALEALATDRLSVLVLGEVRGDAIAIEAAEQSLSIPLDDAERVWHSVGARAEG
jgi:hypothetical protein